MPTIGIRAETKPGERRVALVPRDVATLTERYPDLRVLVQRSASRAYPDADYAALPGVEVVDSIDDAPLIVAVKEIKADYILPGKVYVFFSHTFKGQMGNMPALEALLERGCTLVDYEMLVEDVDEDDFDRGLETARREVLENHDLDLRRLLPRTAFQRRTVHFCRMAGVVGAFDSFWALGQRLMAQGVASPFGALQRARNYRRWADARDHGLGRLRDAIRAGGVPAELAPLVVGVTGFSRNGDPGKTAAGAREVLDALGARRLGGPDEIEQLEPRDRNRIWWLSFDRDDTGDLEAFESSLGKLTVLVNCIRWMWWERSFVTLDYARKRLRDGNGRPRVIGDVSCDAGGSVEFCAPTDFERPTYVYEPARDTTPGRDFWFEPENNEWLLSPDGPCRLGFEGDGPVVMAVDNLPTAFPRDASKEFSSYMMRARNFPTAKRHPLPYQLAALAADPAERVADLDPAAISRPLRRAIMTYRGRLAPGYEYLETYLEKSRRSR